MLQRIQRNKIITFLSYVILFTCIFHFEVKILADNFRALDLLILRSGCKLEKILVEGNNVLSRSEIIEQMDNFLGRNTFFVSVKSMRKKVEKHPFCQSAEITRKLPNQITIRIKEHKPLALFNGESIINTEFKTIAKYDPKDKSHKNLKLISIVGNNMESAKTLIGELKKFPELFHSLNKIEYISGRRWNIEFSNNLLVKLPEDNVDNALASLSKLNKEKNILSKSNLKTIDLRVDDRVFLENELSK